MHYKSTLNICLLCFLTCGTIAQTTIRLPKVIGSNMVLQRNQPIPIWGWAKTNTTVFIEFKGYKKEAKADTAGYWHTVLNAQNASGTPSEMIISSKDTVIKISNILIGEVWLCSGQSNMEYTMKRTYQGPPAKGIDSAALELSTHNSQIRLFKVEPVLSRPDVTSKGWNESGGDALAQISAPGYYFAKNLLNKLHVPIGIISSSWGGTRIEPWTPASGYKALPAFKGADSKTPYLISGVPAGDIYNSMILPLAPFAIKGVLWYQGESNCVFKDSLNYADKMQALIQSWRKQWQQAKLPFYSVLIAPYYYSKLKVKDAPDAESLPRFWQGQIASLAIPHTEMITISDLVDDVADIHPSYKWEVGRRLAAVALAKSYGYKEINYSGPRFRSLKIKDNKIIISFNFNEGLKSSDGKSLNYFEIAGQNRQYVKADAQIQDNKIIVSSPQISNPEFVRFAWDEAAKPNLTNNTNLPAFPFTSNSVTNYLK